MGILFIVATPIGNLGDMTPRAKETLGSCDLLLCEDTRVTRKLLTHFGIQTKTLSFHQHSSETVYKEIFGLLSEGKNIALVTDAGTPGVSDPGNMLVKRALVKGIAVSPIPGPSALTAALSVSGFQSERATFLGFPPQKNKRKRYFEELAEISHTIVLYESNHRIHKTIQELASVLPPGREMTVCRELTKLFETLYHGSVEAFQKEIRIEPKGEFVIVIGPLT